ncbi:MAG: thioredoxin family protein [Gammaproteobacteria bacterium]|jgi:peroxiredoxin
MTLTPSVMTPLGSTAPYFKLPDVHNNLHELRDFEGANAMLVAFISHHCPYTTHILPALVEMIKEYQPKGLAAVAINANDPAQHEEDRPDRMAKAEKTYGFTFPYLDNESQEVAKAFQASCTPDFFLYDHNLKLVYRGRFDDSRPDNDVSVTGDQLRGAIEALLKGQEPPKPQKPSVGCNIKWKPGNEPEYFIEQQRKYA